MKTLLLWDIDGTLIDSGGAGEGGLIRSLHERFGITDNLRWLDWAGRTDVWITRQILTHHGLPTDQAHLDRFLDGYLEALAAGMNNPRARLLPGIAEFFAHTAQQPHLVHGLLTGNLERGAKIKLGHFHFWAHFAFGAFADDSEHRNDLGPHALRRAQSCHPAHRFSGENTYVIGDTPHDIACGKIIGARTIAVATGKFSSAELAAHSPDFLYASLADVAAFTASLPPS